MASFRFQGIGKTILYVFLISVLAALPVIFFVVNISTSALSGFDQSLKKDFPDFQIVNGELQSNAKNPVEVKSGSYMFIFDSTGAYGQKEMEEKQNAVGLLKNQFVLVTGGQSQSYTYNLAGNVNLTKEDVAGFADQISAMKPLIIGILSVIVYLFSSASKFIEVTILALIGLLFKNAAGKRMNFKQLWVISAYAVTLSTLFFAITGVLQIHVISAGLVNWAIHLIMLFLALKEVPGKPAGKKQA